jgi:hypothetical protein
VGGEDRIFCFDNVSFRFVISIYSIHITIELATCISYIRTRNKGIEAETIHHRFVSLTVSYKWESTSILHCIFILGTGSLWLIENNKSKMYLNDSSSRVLRIIKTSTNNYN